MTNRSRPRPLGPILRHAASLAALGVVGLALVGDSSQEFCTDGYAAARIDLAFTSTCPTWFGPARGEIHLATNKSDGALSAEFDEAIFNAGFRGASASMGIHDLDDLCRVASFGIFAAESTEHDGYTCSHIPLAPGGPVEMKCTSVSARQGHPNDPPPPPRTYPDSGSTEADATTDSSADASLDASLDGEAELDASVDSASDASIDSSADASMADASRDDAAVAPTPDPAPTATGRPYDSRSRDPNCTITFYPAPAR